jgi:hypothetical protein
MVALVVLGVFAIVVVFAVLAATMETRTPRGRGDGDFPERIVAAAVSRLFTGRGDWGRAMLAELSHVDGRVHRWRFAVGVVRVALFPPSRQRSRAVVVALVGWVVAIGMTVAAAREVPSLSLFAGVLGLLLCGCATTAAARSWRLPRTPPQVVVGVVALTGFVAVVGCAVWTAAAHPSATTDPTHVYTVLFAIVLCVCLVLTLTGPGPGAHPNTVLWSVLAATLACAATWTVATLTTSAGPVGYLWVTGAAAGLAVSIGVSAATGSSSAGIRAALLTAFLSAPIHVAIDLTTLLRASDYTLTSPYDKAAYPHSGFPDVASYLLSDTLGGEIIGGLMLYPIILLLCGLLGTLAGDGFRRHAPAGRGRLRE